MAEIKCIGIVGAGLMGTGIAECAAASGYEVVLVKATPGSPEGALAKIVSSLKKQVQKGKLAEIEADAILQRITTSADKEAVAKCDLVIESIVEDLATKQHLFAELHAVCKPETIFATNTSTLRVMDLAKSSGRPDRTIGLHFFSPVPAMKLVEVAHLPTTEADVLATATAFVTKLGKTAVPVLDSTGFVVNRLLVPYLVGAIAAYEAGLGRAEEIDTAMRLGCGHPMGPLALSDLIGLDVVYAMAKLLYADFQDDRYKPPALLRRLVQQGQLGKKTKVGLYDYRVEPARANAEVFAPLEAHAA